jgi:hypothetical protein
MLLARGRVTASALSGRRNLRCKGQILMAGVGSPNRRGARLEETARLTAEIGRLLDEKETRLLGIRKQQNTTAKGGFSNSRELSKVFR